MEFKFPITTIFHDDIVEIDHTLIPPGFKGDRRALWDTIGKVSEILNAMGEASAAAQGLTTPITTSDRLRNSEHTVYLLIDQQAGDGRGAVTGMLKTGKKSLYIFDRNGQHYQVSPTCVLDFYVHESCQRMGLGKQLYEHMLQKENTEPIQMAIDRPSEKFLGFLNKHYNLKDPVKQMNNYVVFDDFFPKTQETNGTVQIIPESGGKKVSANGLQAYTSPMGRYGAPRPPCSMGQIIHNQTSTIQKSPETQGDTKQLVEDQINLSPKLERPRSLSIQQNEEIDVNNEKNDDIEEDEVHDVADDAMTKDDIINKLSIESNDDDDDKSSNRRTPSHLTEKGYFDLKFYHNKLW